MEPASPLILEKLKNCGFDAGQIHQLHVYGTLINQWNKAINLVAPSTLPQLWERHLLDSAQLVSILKKQSNGEIGIVTDLGSGGGLPGLVLAIGGIKHITMIESDKRKCIFLQEVSRENKLTNVTIINDRIEKANPEKADFVTARALAPLKQLVEWATPLLKENGRMVFLKGMDVQAEINELSNEINDKVQLIQSITDKGAHIVVI